MRSPAGLVIVVMLWCQGYLGLRGEVYKGIRQDRAWLLLPDEDGSGHMQVMSQCSTAYLQTSGQRKTR